MVIFLQDTKGIGERTAGLGLDCQRNLCEGCASPQLLLQDSIFQFRRLWEDAITTLHLSSWKILPFSIRRGESTSAFKRDMSFEELMQQGCWSNVATARIYLDEGLQEMQPLSVKPPTRLVLQQAISAERQQGTHGGER